MGTEHTGSRWLSLVVDDYGLHEGICQAALALVGMQRVQGVGCMVGAPAWGAWAGPLKALDPTSVDVGLHLDFTEYPVQRPQRQLGRLIARSWLRGLNRTTVRAEIRAQLDAFERGMGRAPAFVDGHQHVHQLPMVRDALLNELHRRYAPSLPWLRSTRSGDGMGFKSSVIEALGSKALLANARKLGFKTNRALLGVYGFTGTEHQHLARVAEWLRRAQTGDVLMCHPSKSADPADAIGPAREMEWRVLAGDAMGDLLRQQGVTLAPMSHMLADGWPMRGPD